MKAPSRFAFLFAAAASMLPAYADVDHRTPMDPRFERHRHPRTDDDWVTLATPTPTRYGTEHIWVGRDEGWFRTIRIEAVAGRVFVRSLDMHSGRFKRTYRLDAWLDAHHPVLYVDLGKPWLIDQLAVTTARKPAGSYTVQGSSGPVPRTQIVGSL